MQIHEVGDFSKDTFIKRFEYGRAVIFYMYAVSVVFFVLSGFVVYLSINYPEIRNKDPNIFIAAAGVLVFFGVFMLVCAMFTAKSRTKIFEIHEKGILCINNDERIYTPFGDIEDVYLFRSGKTGKLINNLAYRRNSKHEFEWIHFGLKDFWGFREEFSARHVSERLPKIIKSLESGEAVTFHYLSTKEFWKKRVVGNFLKISTSPIHLTMNEMDVGGEKCLMNEINRVPLNRSGKNITIKNKKGRKIFSTMAFSIISLDLFVHTIDFIIENHRTAARSS